MIAICAIGWNATHHGKRWLDSVKRNSFGHDVKLFLLDNGSSDSTYAMFASYKPEVLLRNNENESIHKGWNRLLREAFKINPEMIVLSNDDVMVGPRWLDAALREIRKGGLRYFLPNGNVGHVDTLDADVTAALPSLSQTTVPARAAWCLMFPPTALPVFMPIPEELVLWYGDDQIHARLAAAGYSCEAINDCCAKHIGSVSVMRRPDYSAVIEKDKQTYIRMYGKLP